MTSAMAQGSVANTCSVLFNPPQIGAYVSFVRVFLLHVLYQEMYECNSDRGARSNMDNLWVFDCATRLPGLIYVTSL